MEKMFVKLEKKITKLEKTLANLEKKIDSLCKLEKGMLKSGAAKAKPKKKAKKKSKKSKLTPRPSTLFPTLKGRFTDVETLEEADNLAKKELPLKEDVINFSRYLSLRATKSTGRSKLIKSIFDITAGARIREDAIRRGYHRES